MLAKKRVHKFALWRRVSQASQRSFSAAATAAAATTLTISTTAVAKHVQFVHDNHLLSYRPLSICLVKKIGAQRASAFQFYWSMTFNSFSVVVVSGANLIIS